MLTRVTYPWQHSRVPYDASRPAYRLHSLVAALDAAADQMLVQAHGTGYARFLTLVTVQALERPTQADLAAARGTSAPATSRMVQALVDDGLLLAERSPGEGNRRTLALTSAGERFVTAGGELLEDAFARLLEAAQVSEPDVLAVTDPLLAVLDPEMP